jgi:soluble lytic murein transglycosylase-like protein
VEVEAEAGPRRTKGEPVTASRIWSSFGPAIRDACAHYGVPVPLVVATICVESSGNAAARREEPGFTSEAMTPSRVSVGLMQTLLTTARQALQRPTLTADELLQPEVSIAAGTAYIALKQSVTRYDPPLVAAAYNAGGLYVDDSPANPWRLRCYPIGTGDYIDKFVAWYGDALAVTT